MKKLILILLTICALNTQVDAQLKLYTNVDLGSSICRYKTFGTYELDQKTVFAYRFGCLAEYNIYKPIFIGSGINISKDGYKIINLYSEHITTNSLYFEVPLFLKIQCTKKMSLNLGISNKIYLFIFSNSKIYGFTLRRDTLISQPFVLDCNVNINYLISPKITLSLNFYNDLNPYYIVFSSTRKNIGLLASFKYCIFEKNRN